MQSQAPIPPGTQARSKTTQRTTSQEVAPMNNTNPHLEAALTDVRCKIALIRLLVIGLVTVQTEGGAA